MAAISGASALAGLLGKKKNKYQPMQPFSFNPNENDPELLLRRRRALEEISRDRGRTVDEIGRAGLLGSSAAFGQLNESAARGARTLEDLDAGAYGRQRDDALALYRDEANFARQRALLGDQYQNQQGLMSLGALGDIGGDLGSLLDEYLNPESMFSKDEILQALTGQLY